MSSVDIEAGVEVVCGGLGGGKTLRAVQQAADLYLPNGSIVYTNIELNFENLKAYCAKTYRVELVPDQVVFLGSHISDFAEFLERGESGAPNLLIYDESQLDFTAMGYKANRQKKQAELELIAQARKLDVQIMFVSQDERDVDVYIRRRAQTFTDCINFQKNLYVGWAFRLFRFPLHRYTTWPIVRGEVKKDAKAKTDFWIRDMSICRCYETKALFGRFQGMSSKSFKLTKINKKKRTWRMKLTFFLAIFIVLGLVFWFTNPADPDLVPDNPAESESESESESDSDSLLDDSLLTLKSWSLRGDRFFGILSDGRRITNDTPGFEGFEGDVLSYRGRYVHFRPDSSRQRKDKRQQSF